MLLELSLLSLCVMGVSLLLASICVSGCGGDDDAPLTDSGRTDAFAEVGFGMPCSHAVTCTCLVCVGPARQGTCPRYCSRSCAVEECPPEFPVCDPSFEFCRPRACTNSDECEPGYQCRDGLDFALDDRYCVPDLACE